MNIRRKFLSDDSWYCRRIQVTGDTEEVEVNMECGSGRQWRRDTFSLQWISLCLQDLQWLKNNDRIIGYGTFSCTNLQLPTLSLPLIFIYFSEFWISHKLCHSILILIHYGSLYMQKQVRKATFAATAIPLSPSSLSPVALWLLILG